MLGVLCRLTNVAAGAASPHVSCNRTYKKLGCFKANSKPLDTLLITDRGKVDWENWEAYVHSLACRCTEATRKRGFTHFGLQNFGECWSGSDADKRYKRDGESDQCVMIFQQPFSLCDNLDDPRECAGYPNVNYVYRIENDDECSKSPCKNGATCVNTPKGFDCKCPQGFKGALCDEDIDECSNSPCKNQGTCVNTIGGFRCTCPQGFKGDLCDEDVDECLNNPCKNEGACVNTIGGFSCKCRQGYKGALCDEDIDECANSPCKNGGSCKNNPGSFTCTCQQGFEGKLCDQDVDECSNNPCKNGGTCINSLGGFSCKCQQGFKGALCDEDINECALSQPCKNGGTCINIVGSFECKCKKGYTGTNCEEVLDPCQSSPCQHGGSCVRRGRGFQCKCVAGFLGKLCERDEDECRKNPCRKGSTCVNNIGSFQCLCPPGMQGKLCEQDVNECRQQLCLNGATCVNSIGGFHCKCKSGFSGKFCENDVNECKLGFDPCKNGGTCVNKHDGFQCLCPPGITGMLCDVDVNECKQLLCRNGAACKNTLGSFECRCKSGYSGKFCEKGTCSNQGQYDLGLIIDGGRSVGNYGFVQTKWFLLQLISRFSVNLRKTHFGVILYNNKPRLICGFTDATSYNPVLLKLKILAMEFPNGDVRTDKALKMAGEELFKAGKDRQNVPDVLLVIVEGKTEQNSEPYKDVLTPLKDRGVNIIAVGIGDQISVDELKEIALGKSDNVIHVQTIGDLKAQELKEKILKIC